MFESEMNRIEHEIDDALLFYYAAQSHEEKEERILRAVEASLERLQHCRDRLLADEVSGDFLKYVRSCLLVSQDSLQEGLCQFSDPKTSLEGSYWGTLLSLALPLYEEIERFLRKSEGSSVGCS